MKYILPKVYVSTYIIFESGGDLGQKSRDWWKNKKAMVNGHDVSTYYRKLLWSDRDILVKYSTVKSLS